MEGTRREVTEDKEGAIVRVTRVGGRRAKCIKIRVGNDVDEEEKVAEKKE